MDSTSMRISQFIATDILFKDKHYKLSLDENFIAKGIVDSVGIISLIDFLENELKMKIPSEKNKN